MKFGLSATLAAMVLASVGSIAWAATPAEIIQARQANFKKIGGSYKAIRDELQKDAPTLAIVRTNADALYAASTRVGGHFPKGTGPETGVKMKALPIIWQRNPEFRQKTAQFLGAARGLQTAARGTNIAAIKNASQALGGTCKACHDTFRTRD
ncbi:c-type cytochrome [Sphingobium boeckii]|uniref:Cytochrome c556 n=1 Tax=Sphingobium boeckii TaxID=1082345 RepID=A0A7W9AF39_9SPHN|nr:cytochrome c [Sphingobium boeckii]MBB5684341.1 cytochrome c556 [Sphingobium boeckii]